LAPSLEVLFVGGNKLKTLSKDELKAFKKLGNLEAGNNCYMCSCEFLSFMHQEAENMSALRGPLVRDASPSVFDCQRTIAIAQVFLLYTCQHCHPLQEAACNLVYTRRRSTNTRQEDICYDALISYMRWTWGEWRHIWSKLESSQPPFKLCLHKRDFLPGKWILDNIIISAT
ncbi:toll-like receptor 2, partial [Acipenser ruthenus]|uniref:toll-like receptor 2 n=1 Tax=Acipenser ruthenus TaxID=7906 RepID=UPI002740D1DE